MLINNQLSGFGAESRITTPALETSASGTANGADGVTVTKPGGVVSGDVLIIVVSFPSTTANTTFSGFTLLTNDAAGAAPAQQVRTYYRVANGSEGASFTSDLPGSVLDCAWWCGRFSSAHNSDLPEGSTASGTSATPDPANLTPSWGPANTMWIAVVGYDSATAASVTAYPAGYDENQIAISGASVDVRLAIAMKHSAAASDNPGSFTLDASRLWVAATLALKSAT